MSAASEVSSMPCEPPPPSSSTAAVSSSPPSSPTAALTRTSNRMTSSSSSPSSAAVTAANATALPPPPAFACLFGYGSSGSGSGSGSSNGNSTTATTTTTTVGGRRRTGAARRGRLLYCHEGRTGHGHAHDDADDASNIVDLRHIAMHAMATASSPSKVASASTSTAPLASSSSLPSLRACRRRHDVSCSSSSNNSGDGDSNDGSGNNKDDDGADVVGGSRVGARQCHTRPSRHARHGAHATSVSDATAPSCSVCCSSSSHSSGSSHPHHSGNSDAAMTAASSVLHARLRCRPREAASHILDFLYLGNVHDAQDATFLREHNIRYIINVSEEEYWSVDRRVTVIPFRASDVASFDIASLFAPTRRILDRVRQLHYAAATAAATTTSSSSSSSAARRELARTSATAPPCVLVHCQRGYSRSATIVLAYLVYRHGWSVAEALRYVLGRRPSVQPNLGFLAALRDLQSSMSAHTRDERCSVQSIVVKNVPRTTSASTVRAFFERHVGLVRDVLMHQHTLHAAAHEQCGPHDALLLQQQQQQQEQQEYVVDADEHDVRGAMTTTCDADAAAAGLSTATAEDVVAMSARERVTAPPLPATAATTAPSAAHGEETTLCMVFFACAESVPRARAFALSHPSELRQLCPIDGKLAKVIVPAKLRVGGMGTTPPQATAAATAATARATATAATAAATATPRRAMVPSRHASVSHGLHKRAAGGGVSGTAASMTATTTTSTIAHT